jgi:hypothetical protein
MSAPATPAPRDDLVCQRKQAVVAQHDHRAWSLSRHLGKGRIEIGWSADAHRIHCKTVLLGDVLQDMEHERMRWIGRVRDYHDAA